MLGTDYQRRLGSLINSTATLIEFPDGYENYFEEQGPTTVIAGDRRRGLRTRARTVGILVPVECLPAFPRRATPSIIFTKDFSKSGFGFVADRQYFPGEQVRILLATFWMEINVCRCRRLSPACFEVGGTLHRRHDESLDAFAGLQTEAEPASQQSLVSNQCN